jgi:ABC-type siderophore export system fused ATPase/permease subunit
VIGWFLVTAGCIVIVAGSRDLLRFRRYGLAFAAAVLTVLSLPWFYLCVVQVPIGLVIQLLRRRDVRARFAAVARDSALSVNAPKE